MKHHNINEMEFFSPKIQSPQKETNFLKALGTVIVAVILFLAFAKIFTVVVQLTAISLI